MKIVTALATLGIIALGAGLPDMAEAKDKGKAKGHDKVRIDGKPGKGPKAIPPGQIKRYTRGAKLPGDLVYEDIGDLSKWKLKPLKPGEQYIRIDDDILKISKDTKTVIEAVGIVGDLLK